MESIARWLSLVIVLVTFGGARMVSAEPKASPKPVFEQRVAMPLRFLYVPVVVGEEDYWFIVDTGATVTVADVRTVERFAQTGEVRSVAIGTQQQKCVVHHVPHLAMGGVECPWIKSLPTADLAWLSKATGLEIDGIVGMDVLSRFVMSIDSDEGMLRFYEPGSVTVAAGSSLPLTFNAKRMPCVAVTLPAVSEDASFIVDTGCVLTGTMDVPILRKLKEANAFENTRINVTLASLGGATQEVSLLRCRSMRIGNHEMVRPVIAPDAENKIGLDTLARFNVVMDFRNARMSLTPSRAFAVRDRNDNSGFVYADDAKGRRLVSGIVPGGIAESLGIQVDDQIIGINDRRIQQLSTTEFDRIMTMCSLQRPTLTLRRGDSLFQVVLP